MSTYTWSRENCYTEIQDWRKIYIDFLNSGRMLDDVPSAILVRRKTERFFVHNGSLFRHSFQEKALKCLGPAEIDIALREVHTGDFGGHMRGRRLFEQLLIIGYYWPTMEKDAMEFVRKCEACQKHANLIHAPAIEMGSIHSPWPFHTWSIDLIGHISPLLEERSRF